MTDKVYITMTDKFCSRLLSRKHKVIDKIVIECTSAEADTVYTNAMNHKDMKNVNICYRKPYYGNSYNVTYHDKTDWPEFFQPGKFR